MYDFTVILLEGAVPTSVSAPHDILNAAGFAAARAGVAAPRWRLCSLAGGPLRLQGGMTVETRKLPARRDGSVWVLPGIGLTSAGDAARRLAQPDAQALARRVARHVAGGGRVAAACSAVFLLQLAGLLEGRRATTAWWLAPALRAMAPGCRLETEHMVLVDGPVVTAGAAFAQADLMLHLLRERYGPRLPDLVARLLVFDGRAAQAPFIAPEFLVRGDDLVARVSARIAAALPQAPAVAALAAEFGMSPRTLARHVQRATGQGPLALVQALRLQRARELLAEGRLSVDDVAAAVGYQDATALRRLMKKATGRTPRQWQAAGA